MSVLPNNIVASLRVVAARLLTLRVRELNTRSPLSLLLGLNPIQETNAFSLRHFAMLVPISLIRLKTASTFSPGMVVKSTCPAKLNHFHARPRPWGCFSETKGVTVSKGVS